MTGAMAEPSRARPIRVAVVDDDPLVRVGLTMLLADVPDIEVVAQAGDGTEIGTLVDAHRPDVVLMDVRMPRVDGVTATGNIRRRHRAPHVIVLTTFDADELVLAALHAGASGFLLKDTPPPEIVTAIRRVAAGDAVLSPSVTRALIDQVADRRGAARRAQARRRLASLSDGERAVAAALTRGLSNAEIGAEIHVSVGTVKAYVSRILTKLDLDNRIQIALLVHDTE